MAIKLPRMNGSLYPFSFDADWHLLWQKDFLVIVVFSSCDSSCPVSGSSLSFLSKLLEFSLVSSSSCFFSNRASLVVCLSPRNLSPESLPFILLLVKNEKTKWGLKTSRGEDWASGEKKKGRDSFRTTRQEGDRSMRDRKRERMKVQGSQSGLNQSLEKKRRERKEGKIMSFLGREEEEPQGSLPPAASEAGRDVFIRLSLLQEK